MRKTMVLGAMLILLYIPLHAYVLQQERTWGGADRDGARGVATAADGSVYVTGGTRSFDPSGEDAFLLKYGASGNLVWQRSYGEPTTATTVAAESGAGVAIAPDGSGVLVAGNYKGGDIFLAKFDHGGNLVWDLTWGSGNEGASDIANLGAARFDALGNLVWQRVGGPGFGAAPDIAVAADGSVHVTGNVLAESEASSGHAFVWTLQANGKATDAAVWGGSDPFEGASGESIAIASGGGIVVAGVVGASPYAFARGSKNAKAATAFVAEIQGTVTEPGGAIGMPAAVVNTPAGSETFAGVSDAFLLRLQP